MRKNKFSVISDGILIGFSSFAVFYSVTVFFTGLRAAAATVAAAACTLSVAVFVKKTKNKNAAVSLGKEDEEDFIRSSVALVCGGKETGERLLFSYLDKSGKNPLKYSDGFITSDKKFAAARFSPEKFSADKAAELYRLTPKDHTLEIYSFAFTDDCVSLSENFYPKIKLTAFSEIFPAVKKFAILPSGGFLPNRKKRSFKDSLAATFDRKKAKTFTVYGGMLLLLARFAFFPVWYIISGCLFLSYASAIVVFAKNRKSAD